MCNDDCKCVVDPSEVSSITDEDELDACGNPADNPNSEPTANGCSNPVPGIEDDNPAGCTGEGNDTSFLGACNEHDTCYGKCNSGKGDCDSDFLNGQNGMVTVCEALDDHESECFEDCMYWAAAYYVAVTEDWPWPIEDGYDHWRDAQVAECSCCEN